MTTILALLVLLTALPATGIKAQAAERYYTAINSKKRAEEDGTVTKAPGTRFDTYYYLLDDAGGTQVAYCLNKGMTQPTVDANGDGWFVRERVSQNNLSDYIKNATQQSYNDLIAITFNGYPKNGNRLPEVSGVSNALYRVVTQHAIWAITDGSTARNTGYFLPYVGIDVNTARGQELVKNWDTLDQLELTPEETACVEEARAAMRLYDAILAWKPSDSSFYTDHDLYAYRCSLDGAKDLQRLITVDCAEKNNTEVVFSKTDIDGTTELEGADLKVTGKNDLGEDVEISWKSEGGAKKIKLREGEYTLTEDQAPLGYKIAASINFRVTGDLKVEIKQTDGSYALQSASRVHMVDERKTTTVLFSKTAVNGTEELQGAELKVVKGERSDGEIAKDADGKELKWISGGNKKEFTLAWGTYTMVEDQAPRGYAIAESITFRINKDLSIEIYENNKWTSANNATVHMKDELAPEKPEEPKKPEDPKPEEPKKPEDPKPEEPKPENPKPETPSNNNPTPTPTPNNPTVLGVTRTEENVEQIADPAQAAVLGSRRSPETADPAPLTTLVVLAGSSLVGILTLLVVWHDANENRRNKRR